MGKISQPETAKTMKKRIRCRGLPLTSDEAGKYISSWKLLPKYKCEREMLC